MLGNIYKITPHECCEFYIGSTTDMKQREREHKSAVKKEKIKLYEKIRECGGFDIEVLYEYECENETELRMEEQRCIDKMKPTLNIKRAFNTKQDTLLIMKQYKYKNRDVLSEKAKQYYITTKEARMEYSKQYRIENREAINQRRRERYKTERQLKCN